MTAGSWKSEAGFSLVEMLVGVAVLSLVSGMGLMLLIGHERANEHMAIMQDNFQAVTHTRAVMQDDLLNLVKRPVRGDNGNQSNIYFESGTTIGALDVLSFTRGGQIAALRDETLSGVIPVAYRLEGENLVRRFHSIADSTDAESIIEQVMLRNIDRIDMKFRTAGGWVSSWRAGLGGNAMDQYPNMIALDIVFLGGHGGDQDNEETRTVRQILRVAGVGS